MSPGRRRFQIDALLAEVVNRAGSDLILTRGSPPVVSVNGELVKLGRETLTAAQLERIVAPLLSPTYRARLDTECEVDLAVAPQDVGRFRINIFRERGGIALVARHIQATIPTLAEFRLPRDFALISLLKHGLVFVSGPTGSGKSTTLAAMINHRNHTVGGHIITIEDPVEFVYGHQQGVVSQREIGADAVSYVQAIRAALRQVPSVVLIGETRDFETAEAVLRVSETGHLALTTLHAANVCQALERFVDLFPAARQRQIWLYLSLELAGVISQRLITQRGETPGRVAALEFLRPTPRSRELIQNGKIDELADYLHEFSGQEGICSLESSLERLVKKGLISRAQALANADRPDNLRLKLDRDGGSDSESIPLRLI